LGEKIEGESEQQRKGDSSYLMVRAVIPRTWTRF